MDQDPRHPILQKFYQQYLDSEDSARFIKQVSEQYTVGTLERVVTTGDRSSRRASSLAIGFLGDYSSNACLGRAMHDEDRGVRVVAENGVRELWRRDGSESQRQQLAVVMRYNMSQCYEQAAELATHLIEEAPWFAESWNQRAIAYFQIARYEDSANDCHQTLELNPYHFGAAVGMAHCYLEMSDAHAALECFRRALKLNPDLEGVRAQIEYLQRTLEGR